MVKIYRMTDSINSRQRGVCEMMMGLSLVPIASYFPRSAGGFLAHDSINSPDDGVGARFTCMAAVGRNRLIGPGSPGRFFWRVK